MIGGRPSLAQLRFFSADDQDVQLVGHGGAVHEGGHILHQRLTFGEVLVGDVRHAAGDDVAQFVMPFVDQMGRAHDHRDLARFDLPLVPQCGDGRACHRGLAGAHRANQDDPAFDVEGFEHGGDNVLLR